MAGQRCVASFAAMAPAPRKQRPSPVETRLSLVAAIAAQTLSLSQRVLGEVLTGVAKGGARPSSKFGTPRNLEELLMSVPELETVDFEVIKRTADYEIRQVQPFFVAETTMPGRTGFDLGGSGQTFNVLAGYIFGKNTAKEQMEMTTPVLTRQGEKMEMTTPVVTQAGRDGAWRMSFVLPSKYGADLPLPNDPTVRIRQVPARIVAVSAFSGFVTDEVAKEKERALRAALTADSEFQVKESTSVEVAQFNPPFTLPFTRRNEVSLEVEKKG
ncbi:SOUL heme-binding family protein [Wolffia australiana]